MPKRPLTKQRKMLETIFNDNYHRRINSGFGVDSAGRKNRHKGVDYGANLGEALYPPVKDSKIEITAVQDKVNQNFWGRKPNTIQDWGNYVLLYLIDYDVTFSYAHLNKVDVKVGDVIGYEKVGEVGSTGYSSGPHLDLMVAKGKHTSLFSIRDNAFDPETIVLKKINVKSVDELAQEVIDGKWGNGQERVNRLNKAGHDYKKVQSKVNEILKVKPNPTPKPISNVGRTWRNILKPLPLYDDNGNRYKSPSRATRNYKILAEKGDYYQIQHFLFNPRKVWVKKADGRLV